MFKKLFHTVYVFLLLAMLLATAVPAQAGAGTPPPPAYVQPETIRLKVMAFDPTTGKSLVIEKVTLGAQEVKGGSHIVYLNVPAGKPELWIKIFNIAPIRVEVRGKCYTPALVHINNAGPYWYWIEPKPAPRGGQEWQVTFHFQENWICKAEQGQDLGKSVFVSGLAKKLGWPGTTFVDVFIHPTDLQGNTMAGVTFLWDVDADGKWDQFVTQTTGNNSYFQWQVTNPAQLNQIILVPPYGQCEAFRKYFQGELMQVVYKPCHTVRG